ncbi:hypothetical protein [Actinomadura chibensis]|uniref:Uncharacterized protein n=1 Tax=Actinomadura chibensis TaxID=392828 RepID=A0A5D0NPT0_9ACTN|nr:hypothetical protein [Actinomadura chibensis]TYB46265.1 hypothetical protein FXF69_13385 [Actinomadura chibensis]
MAHHRNFRPRAHPPAADRQSPPLWKRLKVRLFTLGGMAFAALMTLVLLPVAKDVLSDKAQRATAEPAMWVSAASKAPESGCMALRDPLGVRDRAAIRLDSDVAGVTRRLGGVWVGELPIDLSLRGGSGQATVTGIEIRPREKARPAASAAVLCHSSAGTPPVAQLTANLDAAPPIVKIGGKRYGDGSVITLAQGEQAPAHLVASITRGYLEFDIVVRFAHKDKAAETLVVYDGDPKLKRPFRVTGAAPRYRSIFIRGSGYDEAPARAACRFLPLKSC